MVEMMHIYLINLTCFSGGQAWVKDQCTDKKDMDCPAGYLIILEMSRLDITQYYNTQQ